MTIHAAYHSTTIMQHLFIYRGEFILFSLLSFFSTFFIFCYVKSSRLFCSFVPSRRHKYREIKRHKQMQINTHRKMRHRERCGKRCKEKERTRQRDIERCNTQKQTQREGETKKETQRGRDRKKLREGETKKKMHRKGEKETQRHIKTQRKGEKDTNLLDQFLLINQIFLCKKSKNKLLH